MNPLGEWIDDDDAGKYWICWEGRLYFLMSVPAGEKPTDSGCDSVVTRLGGGRCKPTENFKTLPGLDQLDGHQWGGVIMEDFVGS